MYRHLPTEWVSLKAIDLAIQRDGHLSKKHCRNCPHSRLNQSLPIELGFHQSDLHCRMDLAVVGH